MKTTGMSIDVGDWLIKPLVAAISGVIAAPVAKMLVGIVIHTPGVVLLLSGAIAGALMITILILLGVFELKDIRQMLPMNIDKYRKL
jgi:stage V sporulation protein B